MTTQHPFRPTLDLEAVHNHVRTALRYRTPAAVWTAIADIPLLLAELERTATLIANVRTDFANLLAAARATLAANDEGELDPLYYLRDEVAAHDSAAASTERSTR
ncbi:MAG TPA: hypothetical protein VGX23_34175 [Actinocrinis sp.]|nr:hypothetical protein [Actinocrinis sp.]